MSQEPEQFEIEKIVFIDDALILRFFKVFSRAEYALKNVMEFRHPYIAKANWDKFANEIDNDFYNITEENIVEAREYLWDNPPKKQKIKNENLFFDGFIINSNEKKTQQLLLMVRAVRNNLFHGGKHTPSTAEVNNNEKNKKLLENSIIIIKACMDLDESVKNCYNVQ